MDKKTSTTISSLNVICTILIVVMHCRPSSYGVYSIIWTITGIAVPTFFTISSYLYFNTFNYTRGGRNYFSKLKRRAFSLLIPYLIFTFIGAVMIAAKSLFKQDLSTLHDVINNIIKGTILGSGNPPLWYLKSLFLFCLFAPLLGVVVRWSKYSILLYPFSMFICFNFGYSNILHWIPCLLVGCYCATYPIQHTLTRNSKFGLSIVAILYFTLFCGYFYNVNERNGLVGGYI